METDNQQRTKEIVSTDWRTLVVNLLKLLFELSIVKTIKLDNMNKIISEKRRFDSWLVGVKYHHYSIQLEHQTKSIYFCKL